MDTSGNLSSASSIGSASVSRPSLDEPVWQTLKRDLRRVAIRLKVVLLPHKTSPEQYRRELHDWDLWGPLLMCLLLAILRSHSIAVQGSFAFAAVFFIVWFGGCIVTLNAQLLGSKLSFFQSCSILGYCIFPLCITEFIAGFSENLFFRLLVVFFGLAWSIRASFMFMWNIVSEDRRELVLYPVCLLYTILAWVVVIQ